MDDFELSRVPDSARRSFWQVTSVWVGYIFLLVSMMAGAGLAVKMPIHEVFIAILLANVVLSVIASIMSIMAYRTGYTFALNCRFSFGLWGSKIPSVIYAFIQLGWYVIQSAIFGHMIAAYFKLGPVGEGISMAASALFMGFFALKGMRWMEIVGMVAIPAMICLCIATSMRTVVDAGGWSDVFGKAIENPMGMLSAITIVLGTWIFGASTTVADFNRYARSRKDVILGCFTGLLIVNSFVVGCGAVVGAATGESDLVEILLGIGLVIPAFVLLITNLWTTNSANLYSVGLTLSNVFPNVSRKVIMISIMVIAAFLTQFKPYEIGAIFQLLGGMSILVPPLAGIIMVDYFILSKRHYPGDIHNVKFKLINPCAIAAWIIGIVCGIYSPEGFGAIVAILTGAIAYGISMTVSRFNVFSGGAACTD